MGAHVEKAKSVLFEVMSAIRSGTISLTYLLIKNGGFAAHGDQAEATLRPIYGKYLATVSQEPLILSVGYPSTYDPDADK